MYKLFSNRSDQGISLLEVVVSMVILSIVTAFVASFVAGSLRNIARAEATSTAATIAQEQLDRLLAVPIKQWGYESDGTTLRRSVTETVDGKDGLKYAVTRELSQNPSDLNVKDACPAVVGSRTSRADMVVLRLTVRTNTGPYKDAYTTTTYIARDGNATFLRSSLTIRFNVVRTKGNTPYQEGRDGDPIHVKIEDKFRNKNDRAETKNWSGNTSGGCITFLELNGKSPRIQFGLDEYRLPDDSSSYDAKVNMISGGHREIVFDISRTSQIRVIPDIMGVPKQQCDNPRLVRIHTPIAAPKNRALADLRDIARESDQEYKRLEAIADNRRTDADKVRMESYNRWQYYLVCQGSSGSGGQQFGSDNFKYWFLLPDSIPISVSEGTDVRAVGRWSNSEFKPLNGNSLIEEGPWPIVKVDNPKVGGGGRGIFAGSCLMNDVDGRARPYIMDKAFLNSAMNNPKDVKLPMWMIPLEGWYKAKHPDPNYKGYLPLVIKGINDAQPANNMWGDDRIASLNQSWYSGCKDTPVFDAGWLRSVDLKDDYAQMRLALPFGLYAYSIYNIKETQEVNGQTVTKSRNSCFPQKRNDRYAGERTCIPSGAKRVTFFQTDVRAAFRPASWGGGENIYRDRYWDWFSTERGNTYLPRGPILDACEANSVDWRYCPDGPGKDPKDDGYHEGPDDDTWRPGYKPGTQPQNPSQPQQPNPSETPPDLTGDLDRGECWYNVNGQFINICRNPHLDPRRPGYKPPAGGNTGGSGGGNTGGGSGGGNSGGGNTGGRPGGGSGGGNNPIYPPPAPRPPSRPYDPYDPSCWELRPNGDRYNRCTGEIDRFNGGSRP